VTESLRQTHAAAKPDFDVVVIDVGFVGIKAVL